MKVEDTSSGAITVSVDDVLCGCSPDFFLLTAEDILAT